MIKPDPNIEIIEVDLFCGLGGVTHGRENARLDYIDPEGRKRKRKVVKVIACVNHDPLAIISHEANHRDVLHFIEDIRELDISRTSKLVAHVNMMRRMYPNALLSVWASIECQEHSNAKGGLPKDADSRTLGKDLYRYLQALDPDYLQIENVREFLIWGPMRIKAKATHMDAEYPFTELKFAVDRKTKEEGYWMEPIPERKGEDYCKWRDHICDMGYHYDYRLLNCADYGAPTTRIRYFGIFAKHGLPIVFPSATHAKKPKPGSGIKKWVPIKTCLDFSDEGESIFNREFNPNIRKQNRKKLKEKTMWRIYEGCVKQIAGGKKAYENRIRNFITQYYGNGGSRSVNEPANTLTVKDRLALYNLHYMTEDYSLNDFTPTRSRSIEDPHGTLVKSPRGQVVTLKKINYISEDYSGGHNNKSIEQPCGSLVANPKQNVVTLYHSDHFILNTSFNNIGSSVEEPCPTILASRKHHYVVNPGWFGHNMSISLPCPTIVASQHKSPLSICTMDQTSQTFYIHIYDTDDEPTKLLKEFMAIMGICDIKMRMLQIVEMKKITTLPADYIIYGTLTDQKKFIGNAVPSIVPQRMGECLAGELRKRKLKLAA